MKPLLPLFLLASCAVEDSFSGSLDTPSAIAVLDPTLGGPYDAPVVYVADRVGGSIRVLDAVRGTYAPATAVAPWLRAPFLPSGADRLLVGVAPYVVDADTVDVWAADKAHAELVRIPHLDGTSSAGSPVAVLPTLVRADFEGQGGASGPPVLDGLTLDPDTAITSTWTITWDGALWQVESSRTGLDRPAPPEVLWTARRGVLSFLPRGEAEIGDRFIVEIDRGETVVPLPGTPLELLASPLGTPFALVHAQGDGRSVRLFDPAAGTLAEPFVLPADARPNRLAWSQDGAFLYASDSARSAVWELEVATGVVTERVLPWPTADLASLTTASTRHLYVVPAASTSVWIYDLDASTLVDLNPTTAELDGMAFLSPVTGLAPMPQRYEWPNYSLLDDDDLGADDLIRYGRSVAVSLQGGKVVWMRERDGCLVTEPEGPRSQILGTNALLGDYEPDFDIEIPGTAFLDSTDDGDRHILVNPCSGLVASQSWELTYDAPLGAWRVRGNEAGVQQRLAYEEERYVSDRGEISFTLRSGTLPSQSGWHIRFNTIDGALQGDGDSQNDRVREVELDLPQRPVPIYGRTDGRNRAWVIVAAAGSDIVTRISATDGIIDAVWE